MININSLLIRSKIVELYWVPLLFGLYNVFDILRKLNYYYKTKITKLQELLYNTNKKYNELQQKYDQLYTDFQEQSIKLNNLNCKEINELCKEINELTIETETNIVYRDIEEPNQPDNQSNILSSDDSVISPSNNITDITSEFIDSLSLDYNIRNTSKTNVNPNWSTVTKRFFFG